MESVHNRVYRRSGRPSAIVRSSTTTPAAIAADKLFEQFVTERRYLKNVTAKTEEWYWNAWKVFGREVFAERLPSAPTRADWAAKVAKLRESKAATTSINTYARAINAFLAWAAAENHLPAKPPLIPHLKEEQKILATFSAEQTQRMIGFRPTNATLRRTHAMVCLLLDTGLRISEALTLAPSDIDFEKLVLTVHGKGNKQRLVPMSYELRKRLWHYQTKNAQAAQQKASRRLQTIGGEPRFFFGTRTNNRITVRNFQRDFAALGQRLAIVGVRISPHTCRHTFAVNYLRAGGNLEYLRRILGHSSIETTQKYLRSLGVEDLLAVHNRLSVLARS